MVIGSMFDVKKFAKTQLSTNEYSNTFGDWIGGYSNPESSVNKGNFSEIDVNGLSKLDKTLKASSPEEVAELLSIHAYGHNAGMNHTDDRETRPEDANAAILLFGNAIVGFITGEAVSTVTGARFYNNTR